MSGKARDEAAPKKEAVPTHYAVLRLFTVPAADGAKFDGASKLWEVIEDDFIASGAPTAKRQCADKHGEGVYIAVPHASWKETPYAFETKRVLVAGATSEDEPTPQADVDEPEPVEAASA